MKIGFDISQTGTNKAGCGYFADSLICALAEIDAENEYILYPHFGNTYWDPNAEKYARKIEKPNISQKRIARDMRTSFSFWENISPEAEDRLQSPDIIHANNYSCPMGFRRARLVYTLYDMSFLDHPDLTTEENRSKCFGGVFDAAVSADFIVSISKYSLKRFLDTYPHYPQERTGIVHLGSRFSSLDQDQIGHQNVNGLNPGKFWLSVCTLEPRKNLRRLLRAFREYLNRSKEPHPLVLAGGKGWLEEELEVFLRENRLKDHVHLTGYVSDEKLVWLYKNCFAFLYPSLYEGFGLPVLEAMGFGTAVVTSSTSSLPEVAGEAAHYVDPLSVQEIAEGILTLHQKGDYRKALQKKALDRASLFSWGKSARKMLHFYERVLTMPKYEDKELQRRVDEPPK